MRIAQLITQARGGPVDHAVDLALELAILGHESHLIGPAGPHLDALSGTAVQTHVATMAHKLDLRGARELSRVVRRLRPDVLHCQDRRAGLVGRLVAREQRLPVAYTLHGVPDPMSHLVAGNMAAARPDRRVAASNTLGERWLARTPRSVVITPCDAVADFVREHVGVPTDRVFAVHNGVSPSWGSVVSPAERDEMTIAWLGVMQPVKRLPALVRAVADVPGSRLLLIGDGPERSRVEAEVTATAMRGRTELAGFQADPAPLVARADVLVLPSAAEACPMALLQAMSCGIPVVASRAGGIPEIVRDGVDGILVATGDDQALRAALQRLAGDITLRRAMGASARARVLDRFTLRHCAERMVSVYAKACA